MPTLSLHPIFLVFLNSPQPIFSPKYFFLSFLLTISLTFPLLSSPNFSYISLTTIGLIYPASIYHPQLHNPSSSSLSPYTDICKVLPILLHSINTSLSSHTPISLLPTFTLKSQTQILLSFPELFKHYSPKSAKRKKQAMYKLKHIHL